MSVERNASYDQNFADLSRRIGTDRTFYSTALQVAIGGQITRFFDYSDQQNHQIKKRSILLPLNVATEGS